MPKSRRQKLVNRTRTAPKGRERKHAFVDLIRSYLDEYESVWVLSTYNLRVDFLKQFRAQHRDAKIFVGKNRLSQVALGKTREEEYRPQLSRAARLVAGNVALFFSNRPDVELQREFADFHPDGFARAGLPATETIDIPEGPSDFVHSLEPFLRKIGAPTKLVKGVVVFERPYVVCVEGKPLTADQARMLKLIGIRMARCRLLPLCVWRKGEYVQVASNEEIHAHLKSSRVERDIQSEHEGDLDVEDDDVEEEDVE